MGEALKDRLAENGQSIKWFYEKYIKERTGLTYGGFCHQINGYASISDEVKRGIEEYMEV
jgi:hypothetical protein